MKVAIVLFSVLALSLSAPQPRKIFHENAEDFLDLIYEEAGHEMMHLVEHYIKFEEFTKSLDYMATPNFRNLVYEMESLPEFKAFEEFTKSLDYMATPNFRNLVYEMESLPEFKAVVDFLEKDNIDITYFVERLNEVIDEIQNDKRTRHTLSGRDMTAFINDCIDVFPKDKLTALYEQKIAEDEEFRVAMENLNSEEWDQVWNALWESETFIEEANILLENGIDLKVLLREVKAVFGQFKK
ncbi:hypothetical protein RR46_13595 [Papilio xuthus]|uniref:Uncharacterized protein n=1 Tax=Papilio xuthus TaxID=66420 RepID=A0A194PI21_PAPXU|nr:hypothetical protein RR46_13595 [Papilio xuthus]